MISNYSIGVVLKIANNCFQSDQNNLCPFYKSVTYMKFNAVPKGSTSSATGSLSFSPSTVSAVNTEHILTASYSLV